MLKRPSFAIAIASLYVIVYYVMYAYVQDFRYVIWMFMGAPFVLGWMAYTIIRFGKYNGMDLKEGEEWGYADKSRDSLGIF